MKITKYAQSCLLVVLNGVKILTDIGSYSAEIPNVTGLSAVLITHAHQDHFDLPKLQEVLAQNPDAQVITHAGVGEKLTEAGIAWTAIEPGEEVDIEGVSIESFGTEHAIIYGDSSPCRNTGFLIAGKLYMPGDALHDVPNKPVEILALPTGGPWHKISTAIDYAKTINPRVVIPIHDAMYTNDYKKTSIPRWIGGQLDAVDISFINLSEGDSHEF
jgi:L-ascorbate metabolism protein UlaG (beta-lactamase superfamily)